MSSHSNSKLQTPNSAKRVALVHDWLIGGGAELVVLELHRMFPDAPIYTSICTPEWRERLDGKVITGWLQWWPLFKLYKFLPVLRIWWFSHLKLDGYDLVISSSGNGEAKGIGAGRWKVEGGRWRKGPRPVHICYCHSPTHFYWRNYKEYLAHPKSGWLNPIARMGLRLLVKPLRKWDYRAAQRPDVMIANSTHIQRDIKQYYGRDSVVIHPPVDTERFSPPSTFHLPPSKRSGFITVGRQVPYKKTDLIVAACTKLDVPLMVIGSGPEYAKLQKIASPTIKFLGHLPHEQVPDYMASAEAFILAAFEDFGITPVEALAAGTPVIAYRAGGALDYVQEGKNGLFFDEQTVESLMAALEKFKTMKFDQQVVAKSAEKFSIDRFHTAMQKIIADTVD